MAGSFHGGGLAAHLSLTDGAVDDGVVRTINGAGSSLLVLGNRCTSGVAGSFHGGGLAAHLSAADGAVDDGVVRTISGAGSSLLVLGNRCTSGMAGSINSLGVAVVAVFAGVGHDTLSGAGGILSLSTNIVVADSLSLVIGVGSIAVHALVQGVTIVLAGGLVDGGLVVVAGLGGLAGLGVLAALVQTGAGLGTLNLAGSGSLLGPLAHVVVGNNLVDGQLGNGHNGVGRCVVVGLGSGQADILSLDRCKLDDGSCSALAEGSSTSSDLGPVLAVNGNLDDIVLQVTGAVEAVVGNGAVVTHGVVDLVDGVDSAQVTDQPCIGQGVAVDGSGSPVVVHVGAVVDDAVEGLINGSALAAILGACGALDAGDLLGRSVGQTGALSGHDIGLAAAAAGVGGVAVSVDGRLGVNALVPAVGVGLGNGEGVGLAGDLDGGGADGSSGEGDGGGANGLALNSMVDGPDVTAVVSLIVTTGSVAAGAAVVAQEHGVVCILDQAAGVAAVGVPVEHNGSAFCDANGSSGVCELHELTGLILDKVDTASSADGPDTVSAQVVLAAVQLQESRRAGAGTVQQNTTVGIALSLVVQDILAGGDSLALTNSRAHSVGVDGSVHNLEQEPLAAAVIAVPCRSCTAGAGGVAEAVVVVQQSAVGSDLPVAGAVGAVGAGTDLNNGIITQGGIAVAVDLNILVAVADGVAAIDSVDSPESVLTGSCQLNALAAATGDSIGDHKVCSSVLTAGDDHVLCAVLELGGKCHRLDGGSIELARGSDDLIAGDGGVIAVNGDGIGVAHIHLKGLENHLSDVVIIGSGVAGVQHIPVAVLMLAGNQVLAADNRRSDLLVAGDVSTGTMGGAGLKQVQRMLTVCMIVGVVVITTSVPANITGSAVEVQVVAVAIHLQSAIAGILQSDGHGSAGGGLAALNAGIQIDALMAEGTVFAIGVLAVCQGNHAIVAQNFSFGGNHSSRMSMSHGEHTQDHHKCQQKAQETLKIVFHFLLTSFQNFVSSGFSLPILRL